MSNRIKIFLFFALLSYFPALAQVDTAWVRVYDGPWWDIDRAISLAVDSAGNIYVAGYNNTIEYLRGESYDYVIIKYSPKGDVLWIRNYNGTADSSDVANDIAVDKNGNVYVTGSSQGNGTEYDFVTIKYGPNGDTLWVRRYNGPANSRDDSQVLAIDNSDNVYVAGSSWNGSFYDYLIIKYSAEGDTLWVRRYSGVGSGNNLLVDMAISRTGNIYATGSSWNGNDYDYATIKYSEDGNLLWSRRYDSPNNANDGPADLAIDNSDDVYVTGSSATIKYLAKGDTAWVRSRGGVSLAVDENGNVFTANTVNYDYETFKYAPNGDSLWVRYYYSPTVNWEDWVKGLTLDINGNVYVTGSSFVYDTGTVFATIKYSPDGDTLWVRRDFGIWWSATANEPAAIAVDNGGNVYVTGTSYWFEPPSDIWTFKYVQCIAKPGDANGDSTVQLSDVITTIDFLFKGQSILFPFCVGDCNGDGKVLLSDIVYLINYIFKGGPTPIKSEACCL